MKKFKRSAQSQPKHGKPASSGASKAPVAPPVRRPGWTGPSYLHKPAKKTPTPVKETSSIEQIQSLSVKHQQLILDTIRTSFPAVDEFDTLKPVLREIREALEQKDYSKAFGSEEFLEAYTIRWSPSRALTVGNVLAWMCSEMNEAAWVQQFLHNDGQKPSKIVCFGRGGSDLLACVALLKHSHESKLDGLPRLESSNHNDSAMVDFNLIDRHDWSDIVAKLQHTLTNPPPLSKYATEKARASNISAIPSQVINLAVNNLDILESDNTTLSFLLRLTETAPKGSLLLVVDSPGADVVLPGSSDKGEEKRYPLEWLLYQVLLPPKSANSEAHGEPVWRKLIDSGYEKEYKLPTGLRYPGSLENTRFQVHLLERL
ncbi:hypothetical protein J7337_006261 [Fusarium musae]|uniref:25S rRNA (Uridine(2843)-N(3))-methyltransferase n=1 Tax=Fusarium musae TaxID=1042133 RepID=A0A9P8DKK8_9HYPO|nr:hypothetical protein J7337_006261 [Fusarium musae]KAG9503416.1 hypothetical protein J7337_006261 [Fusarium musae]